MILLFPLLLMVGGCRLGAHQDGERQSWACDNCLDSRQRNTVEPHGQEKIRKILRSRCLDGVATTNIVKMLNPKTLRPETYMVTLTRPCCGVPSSGVRDDESDTHTVRGT